MGSLKKLFARLFKGKSKSRSRSKSKKLDSPASQIVIATSPEVGHVVPATNVESPLATSATLEEISIPLESDSDPSARQVILWRPSVTSVASLLIPNLISRVQPSSHLFVGTATALAFGSPPDVAARSLPIQGYLASVLFGSDLADRNVMNQLLHASATIASTMRVTEDACEVEAMSQGATIDSQQSQRSTHCPLPFSQAECLKARPSTIWHDIQNGDATPRTPVLPIHAMPSLVWTPTTQATSILLGTPEVPGRPYYVAPNPNQLPKLGPVPTTPANVEAPRYPLGLGFPSEDEIADASVDDDSRLCLTLPIGRPAKYLPKLDFVPTLPNAQSARLQGETVNAGVPFPLLPPIPLQSFDDEPEVVHETITIQPDARHTYHATRTLGKGGNGTVWLGTLDQGDGTGLMDVAIKVYNKRFALARHLKGSTLRTIARTREVPALLLEDFEDLRQFYEDEIDIFECLASGDTSPFVAPLLHSFHTDDNFYLVMRYYPENLRQRARNKGYRLNRPQIRLIAAELVLALEFLHSRFIVHHDLKVENVLISPSGHVAVCDFGNSYMYYGEERTSEHFKEGGLIGRSTLGYLAPEQSDDEEHNYKVDMYAFGLLLLDLFCDGEAWYCCIPRLGGPEDFGPNQPSPLQLATKQRVFDAEAWDLIAKLVEVDPDARPEWSEVKQHPYFRDLDWNRVAARGYDPHYRPCDRNRQNHPLVPTNKWVLEDSRGSPLTDEVALEGLQLVLNVAARQKVGFSVAEYTFVTGVPVQDEVHGTACVSRPGPCTCHSC
ncbi:kinase-like protein [Paxillus ammoniavirescens]|nr:kinase-like protein [Paxillus ammoniavirescens]